VFTVYIHYRQVKHLYKGKTYANLSPVEQFEPHLIGHQCFVVIVDGKTSVL